MNFSKVIRTYIVGLTIAIKIDATNKPTSDQKLISKENLYVHL